MHTRSDVQVLHVGKRGGVEESEDRVQFEGDPDSISHTLHGHHYRTLVLVHLKRSLEQYNVKTNVCTVVWAESKTDIKKSKKEENTRGKKMLKGIDITNCACNVGN